MKKTAIAAAALLAIGYSTAAFAAAHYFKVYGEGYGHDQQEAVDTASRYADDACYSTWGQSGQEVTVLEQYLDVESGYWHARVSLDCTVYD